MRTTYKTTVRSLLRTPSAIVWALVFPIVLATVFNFMFEPFRSDGAVDAVPVAVVKDDAWSASPFSSAVDALERAEEPLISALAFDDEEGAREALVRGGAAGAYLIGPDGRTPRALLAPAGAGDDVAHETDCAIIEAILTSYLHNQQLVETLARENPGALSDTATVEGALGLSVNAREVSLTHARPDTMVRFYYALLGMASLFGAQLAEGSVWRLQPMESPKGARLAVGGVSRPRLLAATLAACWTVSTGFLCAAFGYICLTANIDFSGREALCLLGIAVASLLSCGLGALVGAVPGRLGSDSRIGILTAVTCLLSLFAGLYGEPTMELADAVARSFPAATWLNPVCLIRDLFYSAYYYTSLTPFALRAAACCAFATVLLGLSASFMRRPSYEHL